MSVPCELDVWASANVHALRVEYGTQIGLRHIGGDECIADASEEDKPD